MGRWIFGRRWISAALALGILAAGSTGCGGGEAPVQAPELIEPVGVDVDTAVVEKRNLGNMDSYQGEVVPDIKEMYFVNSGQVASVEVEIGDKVKKGQLLATLKGADTTVKELQRDLRDLEEENTELNESAKNNIMQMKEERRRLEKQCAGAPTAKEKKAFQKQLTAQIENIKTEQLKLKHQKELQASMTADLREDIAAARKKTKKDRLYSDVDGEVIMKLIAPGDFIGGGNAVIYVADMHKTRIRAEYIGKSTLNKASGCYAVINGKKYEITAEDQEVSMLDIELGNHPDNTYFDYEQDANASVGDSVSIDLYGDVTEDALVVPSNAVYKSKGEHYVYRMDGNAKKKIGVTTGLTTDAYTQILSGVKEGDVVYVQD